jgi:two-component system, OmpR family, phosphate regulon response regulator PhoB
MAVIVMIDDEIMLTGLMAQLFRRVGHDMHTARNGELGLTLIERVMPDLIILDHMLPGLTGLDVLRKLRSDPKLSHIPTVFYTAAVDPECERQARALGIGGFWWKGAAGFDEIRNRVESVVRGMQPPLGSIPAPIVSSGGGSIAEPA